MVHNIYKAPAKQREAASASTQSTPSYFLSFAYMIYYGALARSGIAGGKGVLVELRGAPARCMGRERGGGSGERSCKGYSFVIDASCMDV